MNIVLIIYFLVGFMVYEIPRVSVFGHSPYSVTFPYMIHHTYINTYTRTYNLHGCPSFIKYR